MVEQQVGPECSDDEVEMKTKSSIVWKLNYALAQILDMGKKKKNKKKQGHIF